MPLSNAKIEVEFCLDAKHASEELLALARALAARDTDLSAQQIGGNEITTFNDPEIVCEIMKGEQGMLWRGRMNVNFYTIHPSAEVESYADIRKEISPHFTVNIPGLPNPSWNLHRHMSSENQVDLFEEWATDEEIDPEVIEEGKRRIRAAFES